MDLLTDEYTNDFLSRGMIKTILCECTFAKLALAAFRTN